VFSFKCVKAYEFESLQKCSRERATNRCGNRYCYQFATAALHHE